MLYNRQKIVQKKIKRYFYIYISTINEYSIGMTKNSNIILQD